MNQWQEQVRVAPFQPVIPGGSTKKRKSVFGATAGVVKKKVQPLVLGQRLMSSYFPPKNSNSSVSATTSAAHHALNAYLQPEKENIENEGNEVGLKALKLQIVTQQASRDNNRRFVKAVVSKGEGDTNDSATEIVSDSVTEIVSDSVVEEEAHKPSFLNDSSQPTEELPIGVIALPTGVKEITGYGSAATFLSVHGVKMSSFPMAQGAEGKVYEATVAGDSHPYVYKENRTFRALDTSQGKFWRRGDFAASRLPDLPHMVQPVFFLLRAMNSDGTKKDYYVPANQVREFAKEHPQAHRIYTIGQLIAKAPGQDIAKLLSQNRTLFQPHGEAFKQVAVGLYRFLKDSHPKNLIHRDLKTANLMYDPATKAFNVVDMGIALRLRRRGKSDREVKGPSNPTTSKQQRGTPYFMAPAVLQQKNYGSEVDLFSSAMVLLQMIAPDEFGKFGDTRFAGGYENDLLTESEPKVFLKIYLETLGPNSKTAQALNANADIKELIQLSFEASASGVVGEAAFKRLQNLPYLS